MEKRQNLFDLDFPALLAILESWNEPPYRAKQIWQGVYQHLYSSADQITELSIALRHKLEQSITFALLNPVKETLSQDKHTCKLLFQLPDGNAIESVLMSYDQRRTVCISTQSGCALGCVFCATGQMGFRRNLTCGEIVEQVIYFARRLKAQKERITNVVIMGMGEPFHNYSATMSAIDHLNDPSGFNLGERRFTISTVGLVPQINRFANENRQVNLAISLHAADDELRTSLVPINNKYPLRVLMEACSRYVQKTHRRVTFEWALIEGVNDTIDQAIKLSHLLRGMLCHVNLIPLNPTPGFNNRATSHQRAKAFQSELKKHNIPCTIRLRRGINIQAGCGQLAIKEAE